MSIAARWLRTVAEIAIRAVGPKQVVKTVGETLERAKFPLPAEDYYLVGIGKAAPAQVGQWLKEMPAPRDHRAFGPHGYGDHPTVKFIGGNHPIPGPESFRAGRALREWLAELAPGVPLVALVSGGGSAAIEDPAPGFTTEQIARVSEELLGLGVGIEVINPIRAQWSTLKAGGALALAGPRPIVLTIQSDVPPELESWVSSGPFDPGPFPSPDRAEVLFRDHFPGQRWHDPTAPATGSDVAGLRILAGSNHLAQQTIQHVARREGLSVALYPESLDGEAHQIGADIARTAAASDADVLVFGGEPTVTLPDAAGRGGRLGRLALGYGLCDWEHPPYPMLAAATDGRDGGSAGAGAYWLPGPFDREAAQAALESANSEDFFNRMNWLLRIPPTGANVRDLVVVLRNPAKVRGEA